MRIQKAINYLFYLIIITLFLSRSIIKVKSDEHHISQFKIINLGVERVWCHYEGPKDVYVYIYNPNLTQIGYISLIEIGENAWYLDFNFNTTGEFLFQFYYGVPYTYIGSTIFQVNEENGETPDASQTYTGKSWKDIKPETIFSVSVEIINPPTDPIQFVINRYQPEIKIKIDPMNYGDLQITPDMREITVLIQVEGGNEIKKMEEKIYLYNDPIDLNFSPSLKLSRGLLAFNNVNYLLKIITSDLEGSTTYNEYIISSPVNFAIMRSISVVIIIIIILYLVFKQE